MRPARKTWRRIAAGCSAFAAFGLPGSVAAEPPRVAVSIKPIHALVAAVMNGVGTPTLLVKGAASAHTYRLRPSGARALSRARLIFYVHPDFERFLERSLVGLARRARLVALARQPGMRLLATRAGGPWDGRPRRTVPSGAAAVDPHIWLDPLNAKRILAIAVDELRRADPGNGPAYARNGARAAAAVDILDVELRRRLAPVRDRPFIVFHDAYQYFEARYRLRAVGAVSGGPERRPGARRLAAIRGRIREAGVRCVFVELQFPPALIRAITEGTRARAAVLDPLGASLPPGEAAYGTLMRNMARSLTACLGRR